MNPTTLVLIRSTVVLSDHLVCLYSEQRVSSCSLTPLLDGTPVTLSILSHRTEKRTFPVPQQQLSTLTLDKALLQYGLPFVMLEERKRVPYWSRRPVDSRSISGNSGPWKDLVSHGAREVIL